MNALISDDYLAHACAIVASQFVHSETVPMTPQEFQDACDNLMAAHCPIAYQYFTVSLGSDTLPLGTKSIIAGMITTERPLFMGGTEELILGVKASE